MFFDRRESANPNGKILVITCEGNAGFYEIGFLGSPLDAGFSVLGWNQPGFGESSGSPFPSQTMNAMDAVVQVIVSLYMVQSISRIWIDELCPCWFGHRSR